MVEQGIESARVYVQSDVMSKRAASRRAHQGHPAAVVAADPELDPLLWGRGGGGGGQRALSPASQYPSQHFVEIQRYGPSDQP